MLQYEVRLGPHQLWCGGGAGGGAAAAAGGLSPAG